jgi:hypothetical protein
MDDNQRALEQAEYDSVVNAIAAAHHEADGAAARIEQCHATGNFVGLGDYHRQLARAEARLTTLEQGKFNMDENQADAARAAQQPQQQQQYTVGQYIDHLQRSGSINAWQANTLRQHPELVSDQAKLQELNRAHVEAMTQGLDPNSSEYKGFMYEKLGVLPRLTPQQKAHAKYANVDEDTYARGEIQRLKVERLYQRSNGA